MKQTIMLLFVLAVTVIYTAVSWYIYSRGAKALEGTNFLKTFKWAYWILAATFIIGQFLERGNPGLLARIISHIGSVWLAFFLYLLLFALVIDIFRVFQYFFTLFPISLTSGVFSGKMLFIYGVSIASIVTIGGYINAHYPITKEVEVEIDKKQSSRDELKVVLATDVHLGVILGKNHAIKLMEKINGQNPDIVIFAGDLVDHNPVPVVKNNMGACLEKINAPLGVYAITGNHEFIGKPEISIDYFTKHGVRYIRDSIITIDGVIQIAGRDDREKKQFTGEERKSIDEVLNNKEENLPLILLDHQPVDYAKAEKYGVDLMLSGHTHKGQLWPFSYLTNAIYVNHFGLKHIGKSWFYTSSGFGTWGPPVRVGNRPELVVFKIKLKSK
jgi:uncharacterized protein